MSGLRMLLLTSAFLSLVPFAATQTSTAETPCLACHAPNKVAIDPAQFAASVHGALDCSTCHTEGVSQFPHARNRPAMPDCVDCHSGTATPPIDFDKIVQEVRASVHVKIVDAAFRCTNCHSPHYFLPARRLKNAAAATLVFNAGCLGCHAAADTPALTQLAFEKLSAKHRLFPHALLHLQRNACIECHSPRGRRSWHEILPKSEALKDCTACHGKTSLLVSKLYLSLALPAPTDNGWVNAILFNDVYLTGATRNRWLDWGTLALTCITLLGVGAHGIGRYLVARSRRPS
jgi:hypothetical protein